MCAPRGRLVLGLHLVDSPDLSGRDRTRMGEDTRPFLFACIHPLENRRRQIFTPAPHPACWNPLHLPPLPPLQDPTSKSLVFSQYNSSLEWLKHALPKKGFEFRTLTGKMSRKQRTDSLQVPYKLYLWPTFIVFFFFPMIVSVVSD